MKSRRTAMFAAAVSAASIVAECANGDSSTTTSSSASSSPGTDDTTPPTTTSASSSTVVTTQPTVTVVTTSPASTAPPTTTSAPVGTLQLAVYFIRGDHVALAHETVPRTVATTRAALEQLLAGPDPDEAAIGMSSALPPDAALLNAAIVNRVATIDLRGSFASGDMQQQRLRLAQVVYTMTQFPTVDAVLVTLNGTPVEGTGPDGAVLDQPLSRGDFEDETPAIFVDGPAPFDEVGEALRVHGTANVFEATFMVRLVDAGGRVLYEHFQMATSGTGTRGTFDFTLDTSTATHGVATVRLWEPSAKDGSDTNIVEFPIAV